MENRKFLAKTGQLRDEEIISGSWNIAHAANTQKNAFVAFWTTYKLFDWSDVRTTLGPTRKIAP